MGRPDTLVIGEDIRVVQTGWPVGLPVCRPMGDGLYEVRSSLPGGRIARVLFCFHDNAIMVAARIYQKNAENTYWRFTIGQGTPGEHHPGEGV